MARVRVTLRDVAARVGVHPSTVSRVMSSETRDMVSAEVAEKVTAVAKEMGYRANPFAYGLKTNRSFTIGVVIPDLANPVFPPIIRGIEHTLGDSGYTAILANSDNKPDLERLMLEKMKARQVDGLILATAYSADDMIQDFIHEGISVVLVNRSMRDHSIPAVYTDDYTGIHLAVEHLVDRGHSRIALLAGPQDLSTGYDRYKGFLAAMTDLGLEAKRNLIEICSSFTEEAGRRSLIDLLDRGEDFTAIVTSNDLLALGCYDALEERGLSCPEDLSITGYNDMPFADKFKPPLTSIHIPHYEMGARSAHILLGLIRSPDGAEGDEPTCVALQPGLVVRGSTARVKSD